MCIICERSLCPNCSNHELTHNKMVVRFVSIAWSSTMKDTPLTAYCSHCSREVRARHECTECSQVLCPSCAEFDTNMTSFLEKHSTDAEHLKKSFRRIHTPYDRIEPPSTWECKCIEQHGNCGHCDRCFDSESYHFCLRSCLCQLDISL